MISVRCSVREMNYLRSVPMDAAAEVASNDASELRSRSRHFSSGYSFTGTASRILVIVDASGS